VSAAAVTRTCPAGAPGCTLACLFGRQGCAAVEPVRYVVETSTVSFGQRVTLVLEQGTVGSVERAHVHAARHPVITGWTTPAARILEGVPA
jgi:hypothetical protein